MINQFIEDVKREQERILKLTNLAEENWTPNDQGKLLSECRNNSTYCSRKINTVGRPTGNGVSFNTERDN